MLFYTHVCRYQGREVTCFASSVALFPKPFSSKLELAHEQTEAASLQLQQDGSAAAVAEHLPRPICPGPAWMTDMRPMSGRGAKGRGECAASWNGSQLAGRNRE